MKTTQMPNKRWMDEKMQYIYIHTVEYYLAMKRSK